MSEIKPKISDETKRVMFPLLDSFAEKHGRGYAALVTAVAIGDEFIAEFAKLGKMSTAQKEAIAKFVAAEIYVIGQIINIDVYTKDIAEELIKDVDALHELKASVK